ncbi:hypothetical protein [Pseudomonas anguilliseptica]|uniref:Uncharacterized protein n=1 Tax=Pseudomonas anguilliseptica TaxID=53406 RepID=A0A1H5F2G2_PSEAG|nr:hypothetical protein [Pseudomonas anguilliseptica]SED97579.1 hypothetical protein SAMN05421553_3763 [Pseudomonas anguilliseptica]
MYAPALIAVKAPERNELAALMASFTGRVQVLSHTERAPHRPTSYGKQSAKPSTYRDAAKKETQAVALMRDNLIITDNTGSAPRTPRQMRGLLRSHGICMTSPDVERLAARYQITLKRPAASE